MRKMINTKTVMAATGYSRVQLWRKARDAEDDFPPPMQLGANKIGWFEDEVEDWQKSRPRRGAEKALDVPTACPASTP